MKSRQKSNWTTCALSTSVFLSTALEPAFHHSDTLKKHPFDYIEIDRSFVSDMAQQQEAYTR